MNQNDIRDHLRLSRAEGVGPLTYNRLLRRFGSPAAAIEALPRLARAGGRATSPAIPPEDEIAREIHRLEKMGGQFLILGQPSYPPLLALLEDAPPALAILGDPAALAAPAVAIVGGRNASANGRVMAETLARQLAESVIVVSGLARGIDAAAHQGALQTGRTVAAVAGGLDVPYPAENATLQRRISEAGAVVSETPLGTAPQARHFPRRNRIIAGLSLGVVVVEAAPRSGSLITARLAQEYGREVFAVPGSPLDPRSRGANDLLRQGACLVETAEDVLANLPLTGADLAPSTPLPHLPGLGEDPAPVPEPAAASASDLAMARDQVIELLGTSPTMVDDVVRRCQFSPAAALSVLLELELAGRVEMLPGHRVALVTV
jgi:DNA processing protein